VVTRTELAVAAVAAAWAAVFLAGEGAAVAFAALYGVATLPYRRHPAGATLAVAAVAVATFASGVSEENPASLASALTVMYALGRHGSGALSYTPVLVLTFALIAVDGFAAADLAFTLFVLSFTWASGRLVRRRTEHARTAAATAARLAAQDPSVLARRVVAEERARLAGEALDVVRVAVEAMHRDAVAAERDLDPRALTSVQERGRQAVTELRRLLGLLRSEAPPSPPEGSGRWRRPGRLAALVAAGLMAVALVDAAAWWADAAPGSIALTLVFAAAVVLVPVDPALACLAAIVPSLLAAALDEPMAYGFAMVLASGVLAWSAAADGRPRALAALAALLTVTLVVIHADSRGNEPIVLASFALTAIAGHVWGQREREGTEALATAARLRSEHERVAEAAVREERLRLARELHDVASHAIGAMVMQAGAALALRERDPAAARAAMRTVQAAGTEAMSELAILFGLLDAGAIGPAGLAAPHAEGDLAEAIEALAARMRSGGLRVTVSTPAAPPDDPVLVAAVYRVVQEALTNVARHAPGSQAQVAVTIAGGWLGVMVRDDGTGATEEPSPGGGFGLVGLAERVRALGGDLAAGPAPAGGFTVTARLPA
jgi:signal transduction histidine kinase